MPNLCGDAVGLLTHWIWNFYPALHLLSTNSIWRRKRSCSCMAYSLCVVAPSVSRDCLFGLCQRWRDIAVASTQTQFSPTGLLAQEQFHVERSLTTSRWETMWWRLFRSSVDSSQLCQFQAPGRCHWLPSCYQKTWTLDFMPWNAGRKDSDKPKEILL